MLKVENFSKSYGRKLILQLELLEFQNGIYWIKGENGTGKSTLMKCLAGLLSFQGEISLYGKSLKKSPEQYLKHVNFSETEPIYPEFLTARQLINFYISCKKGSINEVEKLIQDFQMLHYIDHEPVSNFSSGMLKKLSIILAFIGNPDVILLDEPYITLDQNAISVLNAYLMIQKQNGKTIILTSHLEKLPFETINVELTKQP